MGKVIEIEVPEDLEKEFIDTLKELVENARTLLLMKIVEKSELTEERASIVNKHAN